MKAARRKRRENSVCVEGCVVVDVGGSVVVVVVVMMELRRLEVGVLGVGGMIDTRRAELRWGVVRTGGRLN